MNEVIQNVYFPPPQSPRFPFYWSAMGEERRGSTRYRWEGSKRGKAGRILFQLTLAGEGKIRIGSDAPVTVGPGTGFLARLPSDHCYYYVKGSPPWHFLWIIWAGSAVNSIWDSLNKTLVRRITMNLNSPEIRLLLSTVRSHSGVGSNSLHDVVDAYRFFLIACQEVPNPMVGDRRPRISNRIDRVYRRQPEASIGKNGIACQLELSRFQLYRAAKKELGVSPKEWIARQKVQQACHLLKDQSKSIGTIAMQVGIPDANYFARFFRVRTGYTPRDWRRHFATRTSGNK